MLKTRDIHGVEILSVGSWHGTGCPPAGCSFTTDDLDEIAAAYEATSGLLSPPVKLGHDDNQTFLQTDGYPAAGWLSNVRRVGEKLVADLMKVPAKIADLIDVGAYRSRSVELESDFELGGKKHPIVLTALALLGADMPAVENLDDIIALYSKQKLSLTSTARAVVFTAQPKLDFALPAGMSYDDLTSALKTAFCDASPGASPDDCWVSDIYDDSVIVCLDGRYWQQSYSVTKGGAVAVTGQPSEVQRVTEWRALSAARGRMTYVDNAEHVLADVQAFNARTRELVALRARDGRQISEKHQERFASLRDGLREAQAELDAYLKDPPPAERDYARVMRARLRSAELRQAELTGA